MIILKYSHSFHFRLFQLLHKETKGVTIDLRLLNETGTKVVRPGPSAKVPNVLRVQTDGLSADFVQLIVTERDFGGVDGGREDAELRLGSHLEGRSAVGSGDGLRGRLGSLGDDEVGAYGKRWAYDMSAHKIFANNDIDADVMLADGVIESNWLQSQRKVPLRCPLRTKSRSHSVRRGHGYNTSSLTSRDAAER